MFLSEIGESVYLQAVKVLQLMRSFRRPPLWSSGPRLACSARGLFVSTTCSLHHFFVFVYGFYGIHFDYILFGVLRVILLLEQPATKEGGQIGAGRSW